jgi:hypothetical protein
MTMNERADEKVLRPEDMPSHPGVYALVDGEYRIAFRSGSCDTAHHDAPSATHPVGPAAASRDGLRRALLSAETQLAAKPHSEETGTPAA